MNKKYIDNYRLGPASTKKFLLLEMMMFILAGLGLLVVTVLYIISTGVFDSDSNMLIKQNTFVSAGFCFFPIIAVFMLFWGYVLISEALAKVSVAESGLEIKYPLKKTIHIRWEEFQAICICYSSVVYLEPDVSIVYFVKYGETTNTKGRWRDKNPFKYKRIVRIFYTKDLNEYLHANCPYPVIDLRNTSSYRCVSRIPPAKPL